MNIAGIRFPEPLLTALRNGRLVVFAGAGVSMGEPAWLPGFPALAARIATGTGISQEEGEPEDRFLGRLQHAKMDVHQRAVTELQRGNPAPTPLHSALLRLYRNVGDIRVVTTNYDELFEKALPDVFDKVPQIFRAPALPLGHCFAGLVDMHGTVSFPEEIVLTDADFGRAYLTEGWARRFLVDLFRHYPVLFVGYSHKDTIVNYLARALPESEAGQRFALIAELEDDPQRWHVLGIEPIVYPQQQERDHQSLTLGVEQLAERIRHNVFDWQREITEIASNVPPLDDEAADIIDDALKEVVTTRFFTEAAQSPEWIAWLDNRKHFDPLFIPGALLSERELILAEWLAEQFALSHSDNLLLLIADHRMRVNSQFWSAIITALTFRAPDPVDGRILSRWVSMLLAAMPQGAISEQLMYLVEQCLKQDLTMSALSLVDVMAAGRLVIRRGIAWPTEQSPRPPDLFVDIDLQSGSSVLHEVWNEHLKPRLAQLAEPLLPLVIRRLEEQHYTLRSWQKAHEKEDGLSFGRSAIEPHEQDQYPDDIDTLIDMARDSLEWLTANVMVSAARWCDQLGYSTVPLSRRLAIHTLAMRKDLTANEKIDWILGRMGLYDRTAHHELYQAIRLVYPEATEERRTVLIEAILRYRWPDREDDGSEEERSAHRHYRWLHWLVKADPNCSQARQALDAIAARHPKFEPDNDSPDFTHRIIVGWDDGPTSPWTVNELLSKPAVEWVSDLLPNSSSDVEGSYRPAVLTAVTEAASQQFDWSLNLAVALAEQEQWEADLWAGLIRAWSKVELGEEQCTNVIHWIKKRELYPYHSHAIAELLSTLVGKNQRSLNAEAIIPQLHTIATALWPHCIQEQVEEVNNWLEGAINHPAGELTQFWLKSLSLWWNAHDSKPLTFNDEYRQTFTMLIQEPTLPGRFARSILGAQIALLTTVDEVWTQTYLVPLFDVGNGLPDAQAVWDGYLTWGRLNPRVVELLEGAFHSTIRHLDSAFARQRERFIKYYTSVAVIYAPNPLEVWVPELFHAGGVEARRHFASTVGELLHTMDEQRQIEWWGRWMRQYWENRLQGVPTQLDPEEVEIMLSWLSKLTGVFSEAVALTIKMPVGTLQRGSLLYTLRRGDFVRQFPVATAQLLIYLGSFDSQNHIWYRAGDIVNQLLEAGLPEDLQQQLRELSITRRLR